MWAQERLVPGVRAYRYTMQVYSATTTVFVTFSEQEYIHRLTLSLWSTTVVLDCLHL